MKPDSFIVIAQKLVYVTICRHVWKDEYSLCVRSHLQKQKSDLEIWQVFNKVLFLSCKFPFLLYEICTQPTILSDILF